MRLDFPITAWILGVLVSVGSSSAFADAVYLSLEGEISGFTYTDADGEFTTGPLMLSLSLTSPSILIKDFDQDLFFAHSVMDVVFDNGKPGDLNEILHGVLTIDDTGPIVEDGTVTATITSGLLEGAGAFDGAEVFGIWDHIRGDDCDQGSGGIINFWCWKFGIDSSGPTTLRLPDGFSGITEIDLEGSIIASVPAPSTAVAMLLVWAGANTPRRRRGGSHRTGD